MLGLAREPGTLGTIFRKAQSRIQDPAKLKRLIVDLIGKENWSATGTDIKGDAYEELLSKGAEDVKSGAGQYFTPRAPIQAMVDCVARDAAGFTPIQRDKLRDAFVRGVELVDGTARLAAMNLLLHGIGAANGPSLTMVGADGREVREDPEIERQDFVVTTSNKQLNFVQQHRHHPRHLRPRGGRAARQRALRGWRR